MELIDFYRQLSRARAFELALADLWSQGHISGEMHLGTGEEAVAVALAAHLREGDAVALDHRPTPLMLLLGVDPVAMLREMLGRTDGLCGGWGGHMHLFSREHLCASSGIVGASAPLAAGFALAGKRLRRGSVAVACFGDGAMNQGMVLEAFNLAAAWELPVLFVCKDNDWAITTRSSSVTGGDLGRRAEAFGLATWDADGLDVGALHEAVGEAVAAARKKRRPGFLHARTSRLDGHFLGDPLLRMAQHPVAEGGETFGRVLSGVFSRKGGGLVSRAASVGAMMNLLRSARKDKRDHKNDPLVRARRSLKGRESEVDAIDRAVAEETTAAVERALEA